MRTFFYDHKVSPCECVCKMLNCDYDHALFKRWTTTSNIENSSGLLFIRSGWTVIYWESVMIYWLAKITCIGTLTKIKKKKQFMCRSWKFMKPKEISENFNSFFLLIFLKMNNLLKLSKLVNMVCVPGTI